MAPDPTAPIPEALTVASTVKAQLKDLAIDAAEEGNHSVALDALRELSKKPGYATTEFYFSLGAGAIGTVLLGMPGKELYGAILSSMAVLAYNLSRGAAKKAASVLILALVFTGGCSTPGTIHADAIDEIVTDITARHDAYVQADQSLDEGHRATFLRSSALLRKVVAEAKASSNPAPPPK